MGQVTIYIDPETEKKMNNVIKDMGISKSKWIAELIREKTDTEWPDNIVQLSGAWKNFPSTEEIRKEMGNDTEREII